MRFCSVRRGPDFNLIPLGYILHGHPATCRNSSDAERLYLSPNLDRISW